MSFSSLMKKAAIAGAMVLSVALPAKADWGGLYIGAHIGGAWSDVDWNWISGTGPVTDRLTGGFCGPPQIAGCSFNHDIDGGIFGAHLGLQHQWGRAVVGVEASWSGTWDIDGSSVSTVGAADDNFKTSLKSLFLLQAKLGFAIDDRWMVYLKGGFAAGRIETSITDTIGTSGEGRDRAYHSGWTIGAGLDFALTKDWILGIDYNYVDLDSKDHVIVLNGGGGTVVDNIDPNGIHVISARLSFKLNRPSEPLK